MIFHLKALRFAAAVIGVPLCLFMFIPPATGQGMSADAQQMQKINEMYDWYKKWFFSGAQAIEVEELSELIEKGEAVLVDDRGEREQAVSMLPGAITRKEFDRDREKYKDQKIVVYCTIGLRSGRYSQHLMKKGFDAYNLKGGILAWAHSGRKFVHESKETTRAHVYGRKWSLLPQGYEAVY